MSQTGRFRDRHGGAPGGTGRARLRWQPRRGGGSFAEVASGVPTSPAGRPRLTLVGAGPPIAVPEAVPAASSGEASWCFPRTVRRTVLVLGPAGIVAAAVAGIGARGELGYSVAWAAVGALFIAPATWLTMIARRRTQGIDRSFWTWWLLGLVAAGCFGGCLLVQPAVGAVLRPVGAMFLGLAGVLWVVGIWRLVRRTGGGRIVAIDALEVLVADLALVAPLLVLTWRPLTAPMARWWVVPAAVAAATLPAVGALTVMLCVRLPARQRLPELIGVAATVVGEANAVLQVAQGVDGFRLPAAPLLAVQAVAMWLVLLLVAHAHRTYPEGLDRFAPDAQVRRWSPLPLVVIAAVPALAAEAVGGTGHRPWAVPIAVGVLGAAAVLMTFRHVLVVNETQRLYRRLAIEADRRHQLLDDLVRAVEEDRHRVASQLHELAVEWMAAIGAVLRNVGRPEGADPAVVAGVLSRIYDDVGLRVDALRRLMHAVRPPTVHGANLQTTVEAAVASIFGRAGAPEVDVDVADGIDLDWTTSTIVHRLVLESLRNCRGRAPVHHVGVTIGPGAQPGELCVVVEDDGTGEDPVVGADEARLSTLQLFAEIGRGTVAVTRRPAGGVRVAATLGSRR